MLAIGTAVARPPAENSQPYAAVLMIAVLAVEGVVTRMLGQSMPVIGALVLGFPGVRIVGGGLSEAQPIRNPSKSADEGLTRGNPSLRVRAQKADCTGGGGPAEIGDMSMRCCRLLEHVKARDDRALEG